MDSEFVLIVLCVIILSFSNLYLNLKNNKKNFRFNYLSNLFSSSYYYHYSNLDFHSKWKCIPYI